MSRIRRGSATLSKHQKDQEVLETGLHGIVHSYDNWRGRGYLITELTDRLKVKRDAIIAVPPTLKSGQEVIFDLLSRQRGLEAANVRLDTSGQEPTFVFSESDSGYDIERFVCDVHEEFVCVICQGVLLQPMQTPCEHIFCGHCITVAVETRRLCPICRKMVLITDLRPLHRVLQRMMDDLRIRCRYTGNGCDAITRLDQEQHHAERCQKRYGVTFLS